MLNEFFHQLEFISFDSMETASIVLAIFLDCKAKLRQNDSANLNFKFALHAGRSNWILGNGVRDREWWMQML